MADVVTRFAPSPTGFLHIGSARTALFNWLYARHHGGRYLLRIEDTDRRRSTNEAIDAIFDGLAWLGLDHDGEVVYQSRRQDAHVAAVDRLLADGKAYRAYDTPEEIAAIRAERMAAGCKTRYDRGWRDRDPSEAPAGVEPVIRFAAPLSGETILDDQVQGAIRFQNEEFDDLIIQRSDGTPTYNLAVVVDDHDMGVSHVIRGADHQTNAFQQTFIYQALGWQVPQFAHLPLIHGADGAKLSKRHGALGVDAYRDRGYLPEALRNYLLRLGWSHGDDEIISTEQAVAWFDLGGVGRSPARFDFDRLDSLNGHYLRETDDARLTDLVAARHAQPLGEAMRERVQQGMSGLKPRAKTISELVELSAFYTTSIPLEMTAKAAKLLTSAATVLLSELAVVLAALGSWDSDSLELAVRALAEEQTVKLGAVAQPLRAALTGSHSSPGIFEVMAVLGRDECLARIEDVVGRGG